MKTKKETFIYEGLGFPIELVNAPFKFVLGSWVLDLNMKALQEFVFKGLIHKPTFLAGKELRFMRKFLDMSTTEFGRKIGVSHVTVVKWESEQTKTSPIQESYLRLFFLEHFQNNELMNVYHEIRPEMLAQTKEKTSSILILDVNRLKEAS